MKVPHEIRKCSHCGLAGMAKGDTAFKGVQMDPGSVELTWFCDKKICRDAMQGAVERATEIWAAAYS